MQTKRSNRDPHLESVRMAHRMRVGGMAWGKIGQLVPQRTNANGAKKLVEEYHQRRKTKTLFVDIDDIRDADLYNHASIMQRAAKSSTVSGEETTA